MTELYTVLYYDFQCTLISYYKKNKLFQFKKKKKYSLFNKINELMKSSTRVSNFNNLISLREVPQYLIRSTSILYIPLKIFRTLQEL